MPLDISEVKSALAEVETKLGEKFAAYETELKETGSVATEVKSDLKEMAKDHAELVSEVTSVKDSLTAIEQKGVKLDLGEKPKSMGAQFIESDSWKSMAEGNSKVASMQFKNTILGEGGSPQDPVDTIVPAQRLAGIVPGAFRALDLLDVIPRGRANGNQIEYTREASWTNAAAETAEGAAKPEATLTFELVDTPVRTIAHWIKASKQVLDDAPMLQSYIDRRMSHGVRQRLGGQVVAGNGTSPNLSGLTVTGNHTDLTFVTADNDLDALNRAKYQVIGSDYRANLYVMNPADWGRIERTKTGISGDASYLAGGDNAISYLANGMQPMLWGLPVVTSNLMTSGEFLCLDVNATMLWEREGVRVEVFEQDEDNVQKNLLTIRAEMRAAFTVFVPAAVIHGSLPDA